MDSPIIAWLLVVDEILHGHLDPDVVPPIFRSDAAMDSSWLVRAYEPSTESWHLTELAHDSRLAGILVSLFKNRRDSTLPKWAIPIGKGKMPLPGTVGA